MAETNITHKAGDWFKIGSKLPTNDKSTRSFGEHIRTKAGHISNEKGWDFAYGETVTEGQAEVIRGIAQESGIKEITDGTGQ